MLDWPRCKRSADTALTQQGFEGEQQVEFEAAVTLAKNCARNLLDGW